MTCFKLFGPTEIVRGQTRIELSGRRRNGIVAVLALNHGRVVSTERLIDLVWGADAPPTVVNTLHATVSHIRKTLGPDAAVLRSEAPGYILDVEGDAVDVVEFRRLVDEGRKLLATGDNVAASERLDRAIRLRRGPPLSDVARVDYLEREAEALEHEHVSALEDLLHAQVLLGHHHEVVEQLETSATAHPLRERFAEELMLALYRDGRQADALRAYERLRRDLAEELGIDPSRALKELREAILFQRASLDLHVAQAASADPGDTTNTTTLARGPSLPIETTPLIGRDEFVAGIAAHFDQHRLVTLWGTGGVGKSRVALRCARQFEPMFAQGTCFVDLTTLDATDGVTDGRVTELVIAALRAQPLREELHLKMKTIVRVLAPARLLLVLDNCEHVLDELRPLVVAVLSECPFVRVLATSREAFSNHWEQVVPVPPLGVPEATARDAGTVGRTPSVELFVQRAKVIEPSFALDDTSAAAIASICWQVDGLPLAIELLAGRVDVEFLADLARHASDPNVIRRLAPGERRDGRLTSVALSVRESYERLSPAEQAAFTRLTAFAGPFTRDVALRLVADDADKELVFDRLVRSAMVTRDHLTPARFRVLRPVREFGRSLLTDDEWDELSGKHAMLMVNRAGEVGPDVRTSKEAHALAVLRADFADMRAAMQWMLNHNGNDAAAELLVSIFQFCHFQLLTEAHEWAFELSKRLADDDRLAPEVCGAAALGKWFEGDLELAVALGERSVRITEAGRPPPIWARLAVVNALTYQGEKARLREPFRALFAESQSSDEDFWQIVGLGYDAINATMSGQLEKGLTQAEKAVRLARRAGIPDCLHWALYSLGFALRSTEPLAARRLFAEAITTTRRIESRWNLSLDLVEWVGIVRELGEFDAAVDGVLELLDLLGGAGNRSLLARTLKEAGELLATAGDHEDAALLICAAAYLPTISGEPAGDDKAVAARVPPNSRDILGPRLAEVIVSARTLTEQQIILRARSRLEALARVAGGDDRLDRSARELSGSFVENNQQLKDRIDVIDDLPGVR